MVLGILAFGSHSLAKFQPTLDCFISNFKLKYENSQNVKTDCVNTVVFNLRKIKQRNFFWDTQYYFNCLCSLAVVLGGIMAEPFLYDNVPK